MSGGAKARSLPLGRQDFIEAALAIALDEGVDKLSMRKVAARLGVSPMAMYKHFPNKEELLVATLDAFIADAAVLPETDMPWQAWFDHVARRMHDALAGAPSWVPWLGNLGMGPQAAAVSQSVIRKLVDSGFTTDQAFEAYYAMLQLVIGAACLQANFAQSGRAGAGDSVPGPVQAYLQTGGSEALQAASRLDSLLRSDPLDIGMPLLLSALASRKEGGE